MKDVSEIKLPKWYNCGAIVPGGLYKHALLGLNASEKCGELTNADTRF